MSSIDDLRSYYEEEARLSIRTSVQGFRPEWRAWFLALLADEACRSLIDFGAGPGWECDAFLDAGLRTVGLDLATGNARLAADRGAQVVPGSIAAPPFRSNSFDAGWSMSTLMHVSEDEVPAVARAMVAVLRPGAPLFIGLWGGERRDEIDETQIDGQRRLFSLRPLWRNRELLAEAADVQSTTWLDVGPDGWHYQGFLLRVPPT